MVQAPNHIFKTMAVFGNTKKLAYSLLE
jgi:hypothetical protein